VSDYIPQPGDIGLVSTKGLIGYLIQLGTFSKLNHSFIYEGNGNIIEATPRKGVVRSPVTAYTGIVWSRHKDWTIPERVIIIGEAQAALGAKYFFKDFVMIGCRILRLPVPKWVFGNLANSKSFICSQLSTHCWRKAGYEFIKEKPEYSVTPSDQGIAFWYM